MIISLKTDAQEIRMGIMGATRSKINSRLHVVAQDVRKDLQDMVDKLLSNSPEYKSLMGGTLMAEFGLENPEIALHDISRVIRNSVDTSVSPLMTIGSTLQGGINILLLRHGIDELLALSSGRYRAKFFEVPWLEWLLTQGDRILVAGYNIKYNLSSSQRASSKTGVAIMEKGGGWRVPPQFSGTVESNWITRTFDVPAVQTSIDSIVAKHMRRKLS